MRNNQFQAGFIPGLQGVVVSHSTGSSIHAPKQALRHRLSTPLNEPAQNSCRLTQYSFLQSLPSQSEHRRCHHDDLPVCKTPTVLPSSRSTTSTLTNNTNSNISSQFLSQFTFSSSQSALSSSVSSSSLSSIPSTAATVLSPRNECSKLPRNLDTFDDFYFPTPGFSHSEQRANSSNNNTTMSNIGSKNMKHVEVPNKFDYEDSPMTTDSIDNNHFNSNFLLEFEENSLILDNYNEQLGGQGKLPSLPDLTRELRNSSIFTLTDNDFSTHASRSSSCSSGFGDDDVDREQTYTELNLVDFAYKNYLDPVNFEPDDSDNNFLGDVFCNLATMKAEQPYHGETGSLHVGIPIHTSEIGIFDHISDYDSEGYEQQGCSSSLPSQEYYEHLVESFSQIPTNTAWKWNRQLSPESDEGFVDEPNMTENVPNFEKIQYISTESEKHLPGRRSSASPKEKARDSPKMREKERRKPGRKPGQVSNVLHLWEFMRDLLHSPEIPGIIEWISRSEGVFRVVNSTEVARQWGLKKKNKKEMTYEKLSRSLRYSRLEGYFSKLPEDKNYPKKLCFKFGPKSKNWH